MLELKEPLLCQNAIHFESVWNRVMEGRTNPIIIKKSSPSQISCPSSPDSPNLPTLPSPPSPCTSCSLPMDFTIIDKDSQKEECQATMPCFGDKSQKKMLEQAIFATLDGIEDYKKLENQLPPPLKGEICSLCHEKKKARNQLETAYFLLTGEDFLENTPQTTEYIHPTPVPADKRLRHRFREAQKWQSIYQKLAFQCQDSCFTTLYLGLERATKEEVATLHKVVEEMFSLKNKCH